MKKIVFVLLIGAVSLSSCKKNLPEVGGTAAQSMANEWWCQLFQGNKDVGGGYHKISTYNTAANGDSIWVDDLENLWDFKVKARANYSDLTFTTSKAPNEYYNITVDLSGKVLPKAAHSKTGNITDSIYMVAKFSDDTSTYVIRGHARTKFSEDEY